MTDEETTSCNPWLVIAGSVRAATHATAAFFNSPRGTTIITAARGILVARAQNIDPDYHLIFSAWAAQSYRLAFRTAQKQGTKIVCCDWDSDEEPRNCSLVDVGQPKDPTEDPAYVFPCEVVVPMQVGAIEDNEAPRWSPGQPFVSQSDGLLALQFALDNGADIVNMAGFEGFTNQARPYLDGPNLGDDELAKQFFQHYYAPTLWNIVESCPNTVFTMYGTPTYDHDDRPDNLTIVEVRTAPPAEAAPVADPGQQPERT